MAVFIVRGRKRLKDMLLKGSRCDPTEGTSDETHAKQGMPVSTRRQCRTPLKHVPVPRPQRCGSFLFYGTAPRRVRTTQHPERTQKAEHTVPVTSGGGATCQEDGGRATVQSRRSPRPDIACRKNTMAPQTSHCRQTRPVTWRPPRQRRGVLKSLSCLS